MALEIQVTFDCHDADRLAEFWALALDYQVQPPPEGFDTWPAFLEAQGFSAPPAGSVSAIVDPAGVGPRLLFQRVPEGKSAKNRVHLDVRAGALKDQKVAELVAAGGQEIRHVSELGQTWTVMVDPEGNELCVS
jgi:hypothetical protein